MHGNSTRLINNTSDTHASKSISKLAFNLEKQRQIGNVRMEINKLENHRGIRAGKNTTTGVNSVIVPRGREIRRKNHHRLGQPQKPESMPVITHERIGIRLEKAN